MVFDFLKKRSQEGLAQVQNIASKTLEGKLVEALTETADYVKRRQQIDAENLLKLTNGLSRSRERLLSGLSSAFREDNLAIEKRLEKLEEVLLQSDMGSSLTQTIISDLRSFAKSEGLKEEDILPVLRTRMIEALTPTNQQWGVQFATEPDTPTVIFVIGANGMGKTTTIGKLAARFKSEGNATVLLGACDTFRAAAVEQLYEWSLRANVSIEVPTESERSGDPVPVVTRTIERAVKEKFDVVIVDTSGRLSNNFELTEQLKDMKAAIQRVIPSGPHETFLVVDGSVGRNAVDQAMAWRKYVGVSGLVVTKMDGTARGGFVISVVKDLGMPIKFMGVGEKIDDLREFEVETFVDALLGISEKNSIDLKKRVEKMMNSGYLSSLSSDDQTPIAASSSSSSSSSSIFQDEKEKVDLNKMKRKTNQQNETKKKQQEMKKIAKKSSKK